MKFKQRLQKLEARRPKPRDLTNVPIDEMTDQELYAEIFRLTGKWPRPVAEMTDEELERKLAEITQRQTKEQR